MNECSNCKHYNETTNFVGDCYKIKMMVMLSHPNPDVEGELSHANYNVRKEFSCNQHEVKD